MKIKHKLVWRHDTLLFRDTVIAVIDKDAFDRGWWAYGCDDDWQDVKLGLHDTKQQAESACVEWVKSIAPELSE